MNLKLLINKLDLSVRYMNSIGKTYLGTYIADTMAELIKCVKEGHYILATYYVPREIIELYDIPVLYCERVAGISAAYEMVKDMCFEDDVQLCTYQQYLNKLIEEGIIPVPDLIIAMDYPCSNAVNMCCKIARDYEVPIVKISMDRKYTAKNIHNLAMQLERVNIEIMNRFRKIPQLQHVISNANMMNRLKKEIDDIRIQYPGIVSSQDMLALFSIYNDWGKDEGVKVFTLLLNKLQNDICGYKECKGERALWLGTTPVYMNYTQKLEQTYGLKFVFEDVFVQEIQCLSEQDFFVELATKIYDSVFLSSETRIKRLLRLCKELHVQKVIHFSQRGCKFLPQMIPDMREYFEKVGINLVEIQGDGIDSKWNNGKFVDRG